MSRKNLLYIVFTGIICMALFRVSNSATISPLCQPGILEDMPTHIKRVCVAIQNSDQLNTALKSFINNEAASLVSNTEDLMTNYGKRTDVDHVFLRFGKRR